MSKLTLPRWSPRGRAACRMYWITGVKWAEARQARTRRYIERTALCAAVVVILSGCAVCERHPVACTAAAGVLITSVALSVNRDSDPYHRQIVEHGPPKPRP